MSGFFRAMKKIFFRQDRLEKNGFRGSRRGQYSTVTQKVHPAGHGNANIPAGKRKSPQIT